MLLILFLVLYWLFISCGLFGFCLVFGVCVIVVAFDCCVAMLLVDLSGCGYGAV